MAYRNFRSLPRRTASDTLLCDKAFNIPKIQIIMNIKEGLLWFIISKMSRDIFEKVVTETRIVSDAVSYNQQLPK